MVYEGLKKKDSFNCSEFKVPPPPETQSCASAGDEAGMSGGMTYLPLEIKAESRMEESVKCILTLEEKCSSS